MRMIRPTQKRWPLLASLLLALLPSVAGTITLDSTELVVTPEHRQATGLIVHLMSNYHYLKVPLDDALSQDILDRYLENLDPYKQIFLASDVEAFSVYATRFDDFLRVGYVKPAFDIFRVFRARIKERTYSWLTLLDQEFDYDVEEDYLFNREDAGWPESQAALDELWRKRVKNDLLSLRLSDRSDEQARETLTQRYEGIARRSYQLNSNDVFQLFMNAYTTAVEPHTAYFSPRTSENFKIRMSLSLEGIGAALQTENEHTVVRRLIPGGPAARSNQLKVDDRIIGVGQGLEEEIVDVVSWRLEDVVDLIRGPKNSIVRLEVLHKDGPSEIITLVRNTIELDEQAASRSLIELADADGLTRIGVVDVPAFYLDMAAMAEGESDFRSTTRDVRKLITDLVGDSIDGLIIDLRGNGGGSLPEAIELSGLFIETGPVVQVKDSTGKIKVNKDPNPDIAYTGPLVVLVDRHSASASEIFAGAMQDYRRAVVVGEPTYGKGTVQNVVDLNNFVGPDVGKLGQLKVTIAQFFRVNGTSTQHRGVVPDIIFPTALDIEDHGERALDNALPWTTVNATTYQPGPLLDTTVDAVRSRHEHRVKDDAGFHYLLKEARARQAQDSNVVTLLMSRRKSEAETRDADQTARLNELRSARGLEPLDQAADGDETADEADAVEQIDILLDETAKIMADMITIDRDGEDLRAEIIEPPNNDNATETL